MHSTLAALLLAAATGAPDAGTILTRAGKAVVGDEATYTLRMTVSRPGKSERTVEMKGWKKGNERGRARYTSPPKERGTGYLRSGDNTWMFLPAAQKVVRVGEKQNFGGSDFSNADIFRLALIDDYDPTLAGEEAAEGEPCYKLELKAKDRTVAYDRVVYWVRTDGTYFPVRAEYYTLSGKKLKWLTFTDVKTLGKRVRPTRLIMENALEPGARTTLTFLSIEDGVRLDDRVFTPAALERGE
jgi:outer membrane lipoprotein-sorting protein